jgi:hypothetical protein
MLREFGIFAPLREPFIKTYQGIKGKGQGKRGERGVKRGKMEGKGTGGREKEGKGTGVFMRSKGEKYSRPLSPSPFSVRPLSPLSL